MGVQYASWRCGAIVSQSLTESDRLKSVLSSSLQHHELRSTAKTYALLAHSFEFPSQTSPSRLKEAYCAEACGGRSSAPEPAPKTPTQGNSEPKDRSCVELRNSRSNPRKPGLRGNRGCCSKRAGA